MSNSGQRGSMRRMCRAAVNHEPNRPRKMPIPMIAPLSARLIDVMAMLLWYRLARRATGPCNRNKP